MIQLLAKKMIPNYRAMQDAKVRQSYGHLLGVVGIVNNLLLFIFKFVAGLLTNSVSITADAINNLSDAGSSIISLISFKLSSIPADEKHPFGHARFECIASMVVACFILMLGFDIITSGITKIFHPEAIVFSWVSIIILSLSILVKLWMYRYNKKYGNLLQSTLLEATAADSLSDVFSTSAVLVSMLISNVIHFNLDGYIGVVVGVLVLLAGLDIIKKALNEILGQAPSKELVKQIRSIIMRHEDILGYHDLMIHDYGAHNTFASVHVEVDCCEDILKSHDLIDNIERDIKEELGIEMVIHMDPVDIHDEETNKMRNITNIMLKALDPKLSMHDFRVVPGKSHTNMIFDVVVPFQVNLTNQEILDYLSEQLSFEDHTYYLVVTFDRAYTTQFKEEETQKRRG